MVHVQGVEGGSFSLSGISLPLTSVWTYGYSPYASQGLQYSTIRYSATLSNNHFMGMHVCQTKQQELQIARLMPEEAAELPASCSALSPLHH